MKFQIPKIVRRIDLSKYAEEVADIQLYMWLNPPGNVLDEFTAIREHMMAVTDVFEKLTAELLKPESKGKAADERLEKLEAKREEARKLGEQLLAINDRLYAWWAQMFSQSSDEATHATAEEVKQLAIACAETDPRLWQFIQEEAFSMMTEHRILRKKASRAPS